MNEGGFRLFASGTKFLLDLLLQMLQLTGGLPSLLRSVWWMLAHVCVCACVLGLSQVLKVPSAKSQFFGVKCTTCGIWLGWNAAVAKSFNIIKSFHSCNF